VRLSEEQEKGTSTIDDKDAHKPSW
jgi:hypothetical protein